MAHQHETLQHIVRTVLAFCRLAEHADDDAREDLVDASAALLEIWAISEAPSRNDAIRRWCMDGAAVLERLDRTHGHSLLRAQARLLRLRACVTQRGTDAAAPVAPKRPAPARPTPRVAMRDLGNNQKLVLQWLRENPGARTRNLIANFAGELSDRTVMRALKELAKGGLVRRTQKEGAATYEAIDQAE